MRSKDKRGRVWHLLLVLVVVLLLFAIYYDSTILSRLVPTTTTSTSWSYDGRQANVEQGINTVEAPAKEESFSSLLAASTGKTFQGNKIRSYQGPLRFQDPSPTTLNNNKDQHHTTLVDDRKNCNNWAVVTTINEPTEAVKSVANTAYETWCLVIVGDTKTPSNYLQTAGLENNED